MQSLCSRRVSRVSAGASLGAMGNEGEGVWSASGAIRDLPFTPPDVRVACIAAGQEGVLSLPQLERCGLTKHGVGRRVENGRLHRIHRGVYAVGHTALSMRGRILAAVLACGPAAAAGYQSAAMLPGLIDDYDGPPHVIVPYSVNCRHPGIVTHRARNLDAKDVQTRQGIRLTTPTRTLLSLAEIVPPKALRRATRQALALRLTSIPWLIDVVRRNPGQHGTGALTKLIAHGHVPTRSELEDVVYDLILRGDLPRPEVNPTLILDDRRVIPDFLYRNAKVVIEADSRQWHDDPLARADDAERQALLEAHGFRVLRVTWEQAIRRPAQTIRRIAVALA